MTRLFDTLGLAGNALMAQQRGTQVAGNNIANAATPGYHRQEVVLESVRWPPHGVKVGEVRRAIDQVLENRVQDQGANTAFAQTRSEQLGRLEGTLGELGDPSLSATLDRFFGSFRELSVNPDDTSLRQQVLARGEDLTRAVSQAASGISEQQADIDRQLRGQIAAANVEMNTVARLNRSILEQEAGGQPALELRDQRDGAVAKLAELVGATSFEDSRGQLTVQVDGVSVVQGDSVRPLQTEADAATGLQNVFVNDGVRVDLNGRVRNGTVGALLTVRDQDLPSQLGSLDQFAFDLATAFNATHSTQFGADGVTGRNFFTTPAAVSGAAAALSLDAAVQNNADAVAAAVDPTALPGDNRGALALAQIEQQNVAAGGSQTLGQSVVGIVGSVGESVRSAESIATLEQDKLSSLEMMRDSQSGVSIEEEMLAMNRFQRAYQAASRIVTTVDEMLESILRM